MCGRYVSPEQAAIEREWHVGRHNNNPFKRRFNVQPSTEVPILRLHAGSQEVAPVIDLTLARWGLIPSWWKEARPPKFTFNARIEEAAAKPMWRQALRHSRCLIPAEGWYEWRALQRPDPATGEIKSFKQPHFIHRRDARPFCFAGLMSVSHGADPGAPLLTCSILTTASQGPVAEVHDRMPVVLDDQAHAHWLDPRLGDAEQVVGMAREHARSAEFEHYPVRTLVNSSRAEGEELIEPLDGAPPAH
jgi:putative SOS response-associated peptidase YedK